MKTFSSFSHDHPVWSVTKSCNNSWLWTFPWVLCYCLNIGLLYPSWIEDCQSAWSMTWPLLLISRNIWGMFPSHVTCVQCCTGHIKIFTQHKYAAKRILQILNYSKIGQNIFFLIFAGIKHSHSAFTPKLKYQDFCIIGLPTRECLSGQDTISTPAVSQYLHEHNNQT